jgi:membrane-associated phospholipid phosphatase
MCQGDRAEDPARRRRDPITGGLSLAVLVLALFAPTATASEKPLPRKTFREASRTFFDDGAYLFTFPKRTTPKGAWLTAGFVAGTVLLVQQDDAIRAHVLDEPDSGTADRVADLFEPLGRSYVEAAALGIAYAAARGTGHPRAMSTAATAFEAWLWTFVITSGAKAAFGRANPTGDAEAHDFFTGGDIFPSGHTSRSFAIAAVLADHYGPRAAWIAYPVAALIGLATVQQDVHWASDVLAGAGLGLAIGKGIAHRHPAPAAASPSETGDPPGTRAAWRLAPAPGGAVIWIAF